MLKLEPFQPSDFDRFIGWIDSEDLLLTIAGRDLTFPLTHDQLQRYLDNPKSYSFNVVDTDNKVIGHAEILQSDDSMWKIDKLLIGDRTSRGQGRGQAVIKELLTYSFGNLNARTVELNVFDWNTGAIRCYEKCGFQLNPEKRQTFQKGDETWTAINMLIHKEEWERNRS